jgi:aminopeptidase YwaD
MIIYCLIMNKLSYKARYFVVFTGMIILVACSRGIYPVASKDSLKKDVYYLASEKLEGRKAGEKGDWLAAQYIRDSFEKSKLRLAGDKGMQPFDLVTSVELGDSNALSVNGVRYEVNKDFLPYSFSSNSHFTGNVVFAGYGFDISSDSIKWDDYKGIDADGKWVIILKGDPEIDKTDSKFAPYSEERSKVLTATDHKAGGILLVGGPVFTQNDQLQGLFFDKNSSSYSVPVFQITRKMADSLLFTMNTSIAKLEEILNRTRNPFSFEITGKISGRADIVPHIVESHNVIGQLPGNDPVLKNEYIVIGGHYDHLGYGGPGSGSRAVDTVAIHYGADDNASGVATVMNLAARFSKEKSNRRSLVFVAFGAEEMGLVGSKAFIDKSPVDLKKVVAMFNFDMVGRLDNQTNSLSIGGTLTSKESESILSGFNPGFNLAFSGEGVGPSDHASFYLQNIPVFFYSTGAHPDYHTPGDTPDKINYEGMSRIGDYAAKVITEVANRDLNLTFQEAGSKAMRSRGGRFKVTLGIIPDYAGLEKRGMKVDGVSKGKPAEKAGLQKGDIITAIDGKTVGNIYDYMNRLKTFSEGQTISVDLIRNEQHIVLIVQL